jgi:hypothetical protein
MGQSDENVIQHKFVLIKCKSHISHPFFEQKMGIPVLVVLFVLLSPRTLHPHTLLAIHTRAPERLIKVDGVYLSSKLTLYCYHFSHTLHLFLSTSCISISNCTVSFLFLSGFIKVIFYWTTFIFIKGPYYLNVRRLTIHPLMSEKTNVMKSFFYFIFILNFSVIYEVSSDRHHWVKSGKIYTGKATLPSAAHPLDI